MPNLLIHKFPQAVNFSLNPIPVKIEKNAVTVNVIAVNVLMETTYLSGVYDNIGTFIAWPDADGYGFFDFGGHLPQESILHAFFSGYDFPSYNQNTVSAFSQSIRRFKLNYGHYNPAGAFFDISTSAVFHVMMGGVQWQEFPTAGFWKYLYPDDPFFLTWCPDNKYVSTAQQEYLAYLVRLGHVDDVRLRIKIYYTDESDDTILTTDQAVVPYKCYLFPCGHDQLALDTINPALTISKYEVTLVDHFDTVVFSNTRTYFIDRSHQPYERFFVFKNSLCGIDTLRTTGTGARGLSHEQSILQRSTDYRYSVQDGQRKTNNITEQETQKVNSGFTTFAEADFYREMLLSPVIYEDVRTRWTPIEIIRKSFDIYKDDDQLWHVYFEYNYRFINSVYGNEKINAIPPGFSEANDNADLPA